MQRRAVLAGLVACAATGARAQDTQRLPIVVLDRDVLFARSLFGRRVRADIETASEELLAENSAIEERLEAEERELTARRAETEPDAFRTLASEFDQRVEGIRQAQEAKGRAITNQSDRAQQVFIERVGPILGDLAREIGAVVILDRRMVVASSDQVDITDLALQRINAELGEGATERVGPSPRPETADPAPEAPTAPSPDR